MSGDSEQQSGFCKLIQIAFEQQEGRITKTQIAIDAGISPAHFGRILRGEVTPNVDLAFRIAAILGIPLSALGVLLGPASSTHELKALLKASPPDSREYFEKSLSEHFHRIARTR